MRIFYDPYLAESRKRNLERSVEADEERLAQLSQLNEPGGQALPEPLPRRFKERRLARLRKGLRQA
jgi:hypothetical protein